MQEVDEFLNLIIDGYEKLYKENIDSRDKITLLSQSINQYRAMEQTLQNTLVVAQSAGEQVQRNASEKASNIIKEADTKAHQIINNAHEEVAKLTYKYDDIKRGIDVYRAKMVSLLDSQLDMLKNVRVSEDTIFSRPTENDLIEKNDEIEQEIIDNQFDETVTEEPNNSIESEFVKKVLADETHAEEDTVEVEDKIEEPQEAQ